MYYIFYSTNKLNVTLVINVVLLQTSGNTSIPPLFNHQTLLLQIGSEIYNVHSKTKYRPLYFKKCVNRCNVEFPNLTKSNTVQVTGKQITSEFQNPDELNYIIILLL